MFDIGFWELSLIAVIALLILGPERLPRVARTAGLWIGKMKKMVADVKSNIDEELRMEELNALKQAGEDLKQGLSTTQKELADVGTEFKSTVEEASIDTEDVDVVSAIQESAPNPDTGTQPGAIPEVNPDSMHVDSTDAVKKKAKKKAKRKTKKKPDTSSGTGTKKSVKKASTRGKSAAKKGETKKSKKKEVSEDGTSAEPVSARQPQEQHPASNQNPQDQGI